MTDFRHIDVADTPCLYVDGNCSFDPDKMTSGAGSIAPSEDMARAAGPVSNDVTPADRVLGYTHVGPYSKLRDSYGELMEHVEKG